jgi:HAE1 family hydrophobic/amphiphilic exporter-1
MSDIARQLRQGFYGEEALRIQRGKDDVKVQVRYAQDGPAIALRHRTGPRRHTDGRQIPLTEVAEWTSSRAYSLIRRVDRKRVITVSSDIDEDVGNASQIVGDLKAAFLPRLMQHYPGLRYDLEGQAKRTQESLGSLKKGFTLALMAIFLLLATQFRSYVQPVIIMMAIPFGLIGAIGGHLVMGLAFTIISIFGIVALSGIVVNDSLILIDFINRAHRDGMSVDEAVVRIRPVPFPTGAAHIGNHHRRAFSTAPRTQFSGSVPHPHGREHQFRTAGRDPADAALCTGALPDRG